MLLGLGRDTEACDTRVPADAPSAWQRTQPSSFDCGPPVWPLRPGGAGLTKLLSSWHAPQARRLGAVFQLSFIAAGGRWHFTQLRTSCGYLVSYGLSTPWYVPPVCVSSSPMWILWMKTGKFRTASLFWTIRAPVQVPPSGVAVTVGASTLVAPLPAPNLFWSLWHAEQVWMSNRAPPWNCPPNSPVPPAIARKVVWHSRQAAGSTLSFCPVLSSLVDGTKSLMMFTGVNGLPLAESNTTRRCVLLGS